MTESESLTERENAANGIIPGLIYTFLNFFPEIGILGLLTAGAMFTTDLMGYFTALFAVQLLTLFKSYSHFRRQARVRSRWIVVMGSHAALIFPLVLVMCAALGGMSQAVVEGVAGGLLTRYSQYAVMAAIMTFISMIAVAPWSAVCVFVLGKLSWFKSPVLPDASI